MEILISTVENRPLKYIRINNSNYTAKNLVENEESFDLLRSSSISGYDNNYGQISLDINFADLEQRVNPGYSYTTYKAHITKINSENNGFSFKICDRFKTTSEKKCIHKNVQSSMLLHNCSIWHIRASGPHSAPLCFSVDN